MARRPTLRALIEAIATGGAEAMLAAHPALATERLAEDGGFLDALGHQLYAGDTALHLAAAAFEAALARSLIARGAALDAANRHRQQPLHYAMDGNPSLASWDPDAQVATIAVLLDPGAEVDALAAGGVTPLHRAVRNRCAPAVKLLLARGADRKRKNASGSTPAELAKHTTGRGGSGSDAAKAQQAEIVKLLR